MPNKKLKSCATRRQGWLGQHRRLATAILISSLVSGSGWKARAISEPELPADPLCDLVRSWREEGVYQKGLADGRPVLEGVIVTSLDRDTIIEQLKSTSDTYHLTYRLESDTVGLPFNTVHVKDGDLGRTLMIFNLPSHGTMIKFSFQEESDPTLVSILDIFPELPAIGDQVGFKKENFADGAHSALLIFNDQLPPDLSMDKAISVLTGAGWSESELSQEALKGSAMLFTKAGFKLILWSQTTAVGSSLTCSISETREDQSTRQPRIDANERE